VGRGGAHQLAHVLHGGLALEAVAALVLGHETESYGAFD
jgi:hypothetical protein